MGLGVCSEAVTAGTNMRAVKNQIMRGRRETAAHFYNQLKSRRLPADPEILRVFLLCRRNGVRAARGIDIGPIGSGAEHSASL